MRKFGYAVRSLIRFLNAVVKFWKPVEMRNDNEQKCVFFCADLIGREAIPLVLNNEKINKYRKMFMATITWSEKGMLWIDLMEPRTTITT